jgi:hypothetical protein
MEVVFKSEMMPIRVTASLQSINRWFCDQIRMKNWTTISYSKQFDQLSDHLLGSAHPGRSKTILRI